MISNLSADAMTFKVLIANRSEIAVRLIRTYRLHADISTLAIYTSDEQNALHAQAAHHAALLPGRGPSAYLDIDAVVKVAKEHQCSAIAPGYGFLSENQAFAARCEAEGITFIGPTSDQLGELGDKLRARSLAAKIGVPILDGCTSSEPGDIHAYVDSLPPDIPIILKAAAGGGGRGIRIVRQRSTLDADLESCQREARLSFGDNRIYVERFLPRAKHIEVQILGDGVGNVVAFGERECSLQRQNQKLIEIAPSPSIPPGDALRDQLVEAALRLTRAVKYRSLATIEFLVNPDTREFFFMEANPRIQVEHTTTEQLYGIDLVELQLQVSCGRSLQDLGVVTRSPPLKRYAIQLRINSETLQPDGSSQPNAGALTTFNVPNGPYVRVDTAAHAPGGRLGKYNVSPLFDSLLAKVIVTAPSFGQALALADRSLAETDIRGVRTNRAFLMALVRHPVVRQSHSITATVSQYLSELLDDAHRIDAAGKTVTRDEQDGAAQKSVDAPEGSEAIKIHLTGIVLDLKVAEGDAVKANQDIAVIEAMKMEHLIRAPRSGRIVRLACAKGDAVNAGAPICFFESSEHGADDSESSSSLPTSEPIDSIRPELREILDRKKLLMDEGRKEAVAKRHARGYPTIRESIDMLVDPDSFLELGDLVIAAQLKRRTLDDLLKRTMGDGIITGWATVHGRPVALALGDYLVLAGTQGTYHHLKLDRIFESVLENPAPLVLYAEGGGGRPGDVDRTVVAGLSTPSFSLLARIRAEGIPTIGVANGYVFAGNAALLGTCDLVIATRGGSREIAGGKEPGKTSIGMGGKAMIEGGGLGVFESDVIGPPDLQASTGGIDILVGTEADASMMTRRLLAFFTHSISQSWKWTSDARLLRQAVPPASARRRAYDVRVVINLLVDDGSFIELGRAWGTSVVTGLATITGKPVGILANDSATSLGGAIDHDSGRKATRLIQLLTRTRCAHLISLCDTPGFMVGPEFEKSATGGGSFRIFGDWFAAAQELGISGGRVISIILRNAYGLGAQAMMGGGSLSNLTSASWPSGAFGGMGLEGAVRLGHRNELAAIENPEERKKAEQRMIDDMYERGKASNMAMFAEVDTVIDPADTRRWIEKNLASAKPRIPTFRMKRKARL